MGCNRNTRREQEQETGYHYDEKYGDHEVSELQHNCIVMLHVTSNFCSFVNDFLLNFCLI